MLAELSPLEEIGETARRRSARLQLEQGALDVLERCLRRTAREPRCGERPLHPGVGGDDRAAQIRLRAQVVERFVEGERHRLLGGATPRAERRPAPRSARGPERADPGEEPEHDRDLVPAQVRAARPGLRRERAAGRLRRARLRPLLGIPEPLLEAARRDRPRDERRAREEEHGREQASTAAPRPRAGGGRGEEGPDDGRRDERAGDDDGGEHVVEEARRRPGSGLPAAQRTPTPGDRGEHQQARDGGAERHEQAASHTAQCRSARGSVDRRRAARRGRGCRAPRLPRPCWERREP